MIILSLPKTSAITIKNLSVSYNQKFAIKDITLEFPQSNLIAIVGPNGAGKSTLLKSILGLIPYSGHIQLFNKEKPKKLYEYISYVPQRESVDWDFPTSVLDVVMMGRYGHLGWFKKPGKLEKEIAIKSLKTVGLEEYQKHQIGELSGGQQQRVFIARALTQDAKIFILDEPFAGIDATTEQAIVSVLQKLRNENKTIIVVHHDLNTLSSYFDWLLLINKKVIGFGTLKEVLTKDNISETFGGRLPLYLQDNFQKHIQ